MQIMLTPVRQWAVQGFIVCCVPVVLIGIYHWLYLRNEGNRENKMIWMMNLSCLNFCL